MRNRKSLARFTVMFRTGQRGRLAAQWPDRYLALLCCQVKRGLIYSIELVWLGIKAHIFVKGLYLSPSSAAVIRNGSKT